MVRSSGRAVGVVFAANRRPHEDRAVRAEPGGVPAARGKGPHAGHPVAAVAFDGANPGARAPGQHRARIAEDRLRHRQVEIGRRHRAAAGLAEAPGGGSIGLGDGFDDVEKSDRIGFDPVGRAGQQQAEQLCVVQPVEQRRRQPARGLDVVGSGRDVGANGLGPGDHRPVAGKIGRVCHRCVQDHACRPIASVRQSFGGNAIVPSPRSASPW